MNKNYINIRVNENPSYSLKELSNHFEKSNYNKQNKINSKNKYENGEYCLNTLKKIIKKTQKKKNNIRYNTLDNYNKGQGHYAYGSVSKKDSKLKIRQIETDIVNKNAHKLFWKQKNSKSRQNIEVFNEYFNDDFKVEKYNQNSQANIIDTLMFKKNMEIQKKISKKKNLFRSKNNSTSKI